MFANAPVISDFRMVGWYYWKLQYKRVLSSLNFCIGSTSRRRENLNARLCSSPTSLNTKTAETIVTAHHRSRVKRSLDCVADRFPHGVVEGRPLLDTDDSITIKNKRHLARSVRW